MNKDEFYHTHKLREHRRLDKSGVFFVTKILQRSLKTQISLIAALEKTVSMKENIYCADIITKTLCHTAETGKIKLAAFIVMPDHWHALFGVGTGYSDEKFATRTSLPHCLNVGAASEPRIGDSLNVGAASEPRIEVITLPDIMKSVSNWVSKQYNKNSGDKINWQAGYYETRVRNSKQFSYICNYIESNPIRQQLIEEPKAWQWSSANKKFRQYLTRPWPWRFEKDMTM